MEKLRRAELLDMGGHQKAVSPNVLWAANIDQCLSAK
jgi:hypothetical protein